jgi:hypothetical protein
MHYLFKRLLKYIALLFYNMEGESISFASPEEEIEYWKEKAGEYRTK